MTDTPLKKRVPQRCTLKELEEAVSYFRIAPATIERVQRVLVDGEAVSVVARGDNLTYQPLARTCNKVMDKVEELRSNAPVLVPPGWEEATIVAPVEFIAETRKRAGAPKLYVRLNPLSGDEWDADLGAVVNGLRAASRCSPTKAPRALRARPARAHASPATRIIGNVT